MSTLTDRVWKSTDMKDHVWESIDLGDGWTVETSPYTAAQSEWRAESFVASDVFGRKERQCEMNLTRTLSPVLPGGHSGGTVNITTKDKQVLTALYTIEMHQVAGTNEIAEILCVNWIEITGGNKGRGLASRTYAAIRAAHPGITIAACEALYAPGRTMVKHFVAKYPQVHNGRLDTDGVFHPTCGPEDKLYRPAVLKGASEKS